MSNPTSAKNPNPNKIRLQLILRDALGISRRASEVLIENRQVKVNGNVSKLGDMADLTSDKITVDNKEIPKTNNKLFYIALNKPDGYLTTRSDPFKRKTIYDLLPTEYRSLFPVGRLDYHTEGLLILTNDGNLTLELTHPRYEVEKEYVVTINKDITDSDITKCKSGLNTNDIVTGPIKITYSQSRKVLNVIIKEGQNREIRRLFKALGYNVIGLKRIRIKNLKLSSLKLPIGSFIPIAKFELLG